MNVAQVDPLKDLVSLKLDRDLDVVYVMAVFIAWRNRMQEKWRLLTRVDTARTQSQV